MPGFESQGFIKRLGDSSRIEFDYRGIYRDVIDTVTPEQIRWTCELLSRLSEQQWREAFRAGGYSSDQTARYVAKIKAKIAQGLELTRG